jgi:hypothetical protein
MLKKYSSKKVSFIVSPVAQASGPPISGFASGSFITAEMNTDAFSSVSGADGEVARAASADNRGTITFTLLQTSLSNDFLSVLHAADRATGLGLFALLVRDQLGTTLISAPTAWIMKFANVGYQEDAEANREWKIEASDLFMFVGGNPVS